MNRTWIVLANETHCNHRKAFNEIGCISWHMEYINFHIGDTVYVYFRDSQHIEVKAEVVAINAERLDSAYFYEKPSVERCATMRMIDSRVDDPLLSLEAMFAHGHKKHALQTPLCNNHELIDYLKDVF